MPDHIKIGKNIRKYRMGMQLSQTQLAEKLLVSCQAVSNWERGVTPPDLDNLCELARIFGVSLDVLVGYQAEACERVMIGIDGGGTKTEFVLFTETGRVLKRLRLSQSNPSNIGFEKSFAVLSEGIDQLLDYVPGVQAIYAGLAGTLSQINAEKVRSYLKTRYKELYTTVESDAMNIYYSGSRTADGMVLICGTGSILMVQAGGQKYRFGGWGSMLEDVGSACNIGCDAVKAVLRERDGVGKKTLLTELLKEPFEGMEVAEGINLCYQRGNSFVASLAPYVFAAHGQGDTIATEILQQNAHGLAKLIESARSRHGNMTELVAGGGVFEHNRAVFEPMIRKTLQKPLTFIYPKLPPVYGACVGCCKQEQIPLSKDFFENFSQSYSENFA